MRRGLWTVFVMAAAAVMALFGDVAREPAYAAGAKPTNGTVTFNVTAGSKGGTVTTGPCVATLTVTKPGKGSLTNGAPGQNDPPNSQDGSHAFPKSSSPGGITTYYQGVLVAAGYTSPADFTISGGQINFYGITGLDGGCSNSQVEVNGSTDSKSIPFVQIPDKKIVQIQRDMLWGMDGTIRVVGFGVRLDLANQTIRTSCSSVCIDFSASDSAADIALAMYSALIANGWTAGINVDGNLEVTTNAQGDSIYSLYHSIRYAPDATHIENHDHWIFTDSD
jgi:hypothetical protein